jgi:hypothetical protein
MANTPVKAVRIPDDVVALVSDIASAENRNFSNALVTLVREAIAARKRKERK